MNGEFQPYDFKYRLAIFNEFVEMYDVLHKNNVLLKMIKNIKSLVLVYVDKCCIEDKKLTKRKLHKIVEDKVEKLFSENKFDCVTITSIIGNNQLNFVNIYENKIF